MIGIRDQQLTANFNDFAFQQCFRMTPCFVWSQKRIIRHFLKSAGVDPRSINWKGVISKLRMFRHEEPYKWFRGKYYLLAIIKIFQARLILEILKLFLVYFAVRDRSRFWIAQQINSLKFTGRELRRPQTLRRFYALG